MDLGAVSLVFGRAGSLVMRWSASSEPGGPDTVRHVWQSCRSTARGPGTRRSDRRVLLDGEDARRTVGTERIGHGPTVVEPALRLTHGPRGQRRAQVGDGSQGGQHVVRSYSGRQLPDDHVQYGTTCLLGR